MSVTMSLDEFREYEEMRFPAPSHMRAPQAIAETAAERGLRVYSTDLVVGQLKTRGWGIRRTQVDAFVRRGVVSPARGDWSHDWRQEDIEAIHQHLLTQERKGKEQILSPYAATCEAFGVRLIDWHRAIQAERDAVRSREGVSLWHNFDLFETTFTPPGYGMKTGAVRCAARREAIEAEKREAAQ